MAQAVRELDFAAVRENLEHQFRTNPEKFRERFQAQQVALYVMVGGGLLGRSHAEQPRSAYIDSRVSRRPYSAKAIANVLQILVIMAEVSGLDPDNLPEMPDLHSSGVF